jgi:Protein of unknown function (DUF3604)
MRRSICYCEPSQAQAGEVNTWKFIYTTSIALPKGTRLKFDMLSKGRDIDWETPSSNLKKTQNVIFACLDNGKILQAKDIEVPNSFAPLFEFVLPSGVEAGGNFTIIIGAAKEGTEVKSGNRTQTYAQRRRSFHLYIDITGKGNYQEPEVFNVDIRGNILKLIRVLTPSFVVRNKRFDVIVRFEDEFGNLTSEAPDDTLIELSHEHLRENLNWKLFIPETGFISLPNLYFNEPGVYTITLKNTRTKELFRSSPIKCFSENDKNLFWGVLHGESERIDSTENIESCLRYFRDDRAMNFYASSPFENPEETSNDIWKLIIQNIGEFNEADRFTTFLGHQWVGNSKEEGMRQFIYTKDQKQLLRKKDVKYSSLKKIYKLFSPKELISIPCFTMAKGYEYNFDHFDPDYERVVQIYNSWGSSECTAKEGNLAPIKSEDKKGVQEAAEGSIQKALRRNLRFGFVAGGLDDRGIYEDFYNSGQEQYPAGLTAIIASEHTQASLADALYNRSCYATTGERIIVGLFLAGHRMGSEVNTAEKHGLTINRHLSGYVAGTTDLRAVEIIRNGEVIKSFDCKGYTLDFTYDDMTPIDKISIDAKDKKPPFVYYYLRVIQEDGHMAWSSPIWIDILPAIPGLRAASKRPVKPAPVVLNFDEEEEEEEEEDEDDLE